MNCTVAAVVAFLGAMPAKGEVVTVPRSQLSQYTLAELTFARLCARRYSIRWRIDESR